MCAECDVNKKKQFVIDFDRPITSHKVINASYVIEQAQIDQFQLVSKKLESIRSSHQLHHCSTPH